MADSPMPAPSDKIIVGIVYFSLFLDNVLLTVVVPIIPDFLLNIESEEGKLDKVLLNSTLGSYEDQIGNENGRVGLLLSSKAVVQLIINPAIGFTARYTGYNLPMFVGTVNLLTSSLLFAFGESYLALFLARSLQGVASACIGVSGMCLVAECCATEASRSKVMGIVLGSIALGVLLGYPFGGFLYDFIGKTAPFLGIAFLTIVDLEAFEGERLFCSNIGFVGAVSLFTMGIQLIYLNLKPVSEGVSVGTSWFHLLSDGLIMLTAGAIWLSSSAMAILEPCLPLWLMTKIKPEKWQLGTVFIPDSIGYLVGTNCFGTLAYKIGRWRVAIAAMLLVGVSAVLVPVARGMGELVIPHLCLGLGIGVVDAALVPMLATLVDSRHCAHYAAVYALQQMAVSLAYSFGPMVGGEMVHAIGFPWLMRTVGIINLLYCPLLTLLPKESNNKMHGLASNQKIDYKTTAESSEIPAMKYKRFFDSDESD